MNNKVFTVTVDIDSDLKDRLEQIRMEHIDIETLISEDVSEYIKSWIIGMEVSHG